jgi:ligand-binding sensor domain-containing protein
MVVIAFLLLTLVAFAPDAVAQRLPLRTYTSADGLAGDHITALLTDSRGFLWIGTATGLSRFDGREFRTYSLRDGLPDTAVNALLEDRDGTLWIATNGGLACIDPQGHDIARVPLDDDPTPAVLHLLQARDGRIWVAARRALYVITSSSRRGPSSRVPLVLPTTPPADVAGLWGIEGLVEGPEGDIWIGTGWGLLRRLPDGRMISIRVRPTATDDRAYHLAIDSEGRLWITHWGIAHLPGIHFGVYVLAPEPVAQAHANAGTAATLHERARRVTAGHELTLPQRPGDVIYATAGGPFGDARVHATYSSEAGVVWIATEGGLVRVDATRGSTATARTTRYGARNGLGLPIKRLCCGWRSTASSPTPRPMDRPSARSTA